MRIKRFSSHCSCGVVGLQRKLLRIILAYKYWTCPFKVLEQNALAKQQIVMNKKMGNFCCCHSRIFRFVYLGINRLHRNRLRGDLFWICISSRPAVSTTLSNVGGPWEAPSPRKQNSREAASDSQTQQRKMCAAAWRRQASVSDGGCVPCRTVKTLKEITHPKDRAWLSVGPERQEAHWGQTTGTGEFTSRSPMHVCP